MEAEAGGPGEAPAPEPAAPAPAAAAEGEPGRPDGQERPRSRSRSRGKGSRSSRSSSSSSSSSQSSAPRFVCDDRVEVFGLGSESGKVLNGRIGVVVQYIEETGRYEVKFGPEQVALLRPDKLRKPADGVAGGPAELRFAVDDRVEVFGLESDGGKALNGRQGFVVQFFEAKGRYEVRLGAEQLVLVRPGNLRTPTAPEAAKVEQPKAKAMSLASLLGMGRPEDKKEEKPAAWQSVWERTGTSSATQAVTDEQRAALLELQAVEENRAKELEDLRSKVVAEFAQAGISDEGMIEQAFQQQLEEHDLQKLLRPKGAERKPRRARSGSSGSVSGSSKG